MSTQSSLPSAPPADETIENFSDAAPLLDDNISSPTSRSSSTAYAFSVRDLKIGFDYLNDNTSTKKDEAETKSEESLFECNICLDTAKDAVVSLCGHLYCWPCLHQWMETRPLRKLCPVCKASIGKDKVIPLYGRNSTKQEDPRNKVPQRPAGQRVEPEAQSAFSRFGDGGFHMSFGIGAFPFGYFASSLNMGDVHAAAPRGSEQYENERSISKLFLMMAIYCIIMLLCA